MRARSGDTILVRGGTSAVGLMAVRLGVRMGMTVIATTRRESVRPVLNEAGAAHVVIDDGRIEGKVRALAPGGVDVALELVVSRCLAIPCAACAPAAWCRSRGR